MDYSSLEGIKPYYRNPRLEVAVRIPDGVRKILDVGCGAGAFGLFMKSDRGAEVWGIELMPEPAEFAKERLDKVFVGDCLELLPTLPAESFDLVTYNDVLEHLVSPDVAVRESARVLKPGGYLVTSLPNLRCWKPFMRVVKDGDFPQEDEGIFDRTHLRWFTKKSIPRLFEGSGLKIEVLDGLNERYARTLRILNILTRNKLSDMKYLQFLVIAQKPK
ncbi:MAG: methyltransferase domain-containing protein [Armatimonadetes bacterium]|nr:methyltransferase domain-containing protein [Armatimonadota bacterium]